MSVQTVPLVPTATNEIVSRDPATGEELGRVKITTADEVAQAVATARQAQNTWSTLSYHERGRIILRARETVLAHMEEIALLISRETGKPVSEAISMEVTPTLDLMQYFARRTHKLLKREKLEIGLFGLMGRSSRIEYKP